MNLVGLLMLAKAHVTRKVNRWAPAKQVLEENSPSLQRSSTRYAHQWRAPQQRGHRTARPGHFRTMCVEPHNSRPAQQIPLLSLTSQEASTASHSSSYACSGLTRSKLEWASLQCRHGRQRRGHPHTLSLHTRCTQNQSALCESRLWLP